MRGSLQYYFSTLGPVSTLRFTLRFMLTEPEESLFSEMSLCCSYPLCSKVNSFVRGQDWNTDSRLKRTAFLELVEEVFTCSPVFIERFDSPCGLMRIGTFRWQLLLRYVSLNSSGVPSVESRFISGSSGSLLWLRSRFFKPLDSCFEMRWSRLEGRATSSSSSLISQLSVLYSTSS